MAHFSLHHLLGEKTQRAGRLTATMPDFFLLRYAESLAAEPSLLSVALSYLDHCTALHTMARELQANLLRRTKPTTTQVTNNVGSIRHSDSFSIRQFLVLHFVLIF